MSTVRSIVDVATADITVLQATVDSDQRKAAWNQLSRERTRPGAKLALTLWGKAAEFEKGMGGKMIVNRLKHLANPTQAVSDLIDKHEAEQEARIIEAVDAGEITAEQAAEKTKKLAKGCNDARLYTDACDFAHFVSVMTFIRANKNTASAVITAKAAGAIKVVTDDELFHAFLGKPLNAQGDLAKAIDLGDVTFA